VECGYHQLRIRPARVCDSATAMCAKTFIQMRVCQFQMPKQEQEFNTAATALGPARYIPITHQGLFAQWFSCENMRLSSCRAEV
jgi:hypothetical protein